MSDKIKRYFQLFGLIWFHGTYTSALMPVSSFLNGYYSKNAAEGKAKKI